MAPGSQMHAGRAYRPAIAVAKSIAGTPVVGAPAAAPAPAVMPTPVPTPAAVIPGGGGLARSDDRHAERDRRQGGHGRASHRVPVQHNYLLSYAPSGAGECKARS